MKSIQRILCGIDFAKHSGKLSLGAKAVIHKGLFLRDKWGVELEFFHSEKRSDEDDLPEGVEADYDPARGHAEWKKLCVDRGLTDPQWTVSEDSPFEGILKRVAKGGIDLVLVAKRNRSKRMDR